MPAPGENIRSWSTTALSNGVADSSIGWAEGQTRTSVNDSARSMMAAVAKWRDMINGSITTGGTANAQTITSPHAYTVTPETGLIVKTKIGPGLTNTATMTLNMDSRGAVAVLGNNGAALVGGEVVAGTYADWLWNGTNWILLNVSVRRSAFSAHKNTVNQNIVSGAYTLVQFGMEVYDIGSDFSSSIWTPPRGRVSMKAGLLFLSGIDAAAVVYVNIYKNGASYKAALGNVVGQDAGATIAVDDLATGSDAYSVYYYVSAIVPASAPVISGISSFSWFMGSVID